MTGHRPEMYKSYFPWVQSVPDKGQVPVLSSRAG